MTFYPKIDADMLAHRKPPTKSVLKFMAYEMVEEAHRIRKTLEARLEKSRGRDREAAELLERLAADEADFLGAAQWARRQLIERFGI